VVPVAVVSGFLGAGKTTLIKKLAQALIAGGRRVVVVENEFGEEAVDSVLLEGDGFSVVELVDGCICCTLKHNFREALRRIGEEVRPDMLLVEPSGIFILEDAVGLFADPAVRAVCRLDAVLTVVDCFHYLRYCTEFSAFLESQIRHSTRILLNKLDKLGPDALEYVTGSLHELGPGVPLFMLRWDDLSSDDLLSLLEPAGAAPVPSLHDGHHHHGHLRFQTFVVKPAQAQPREQIESALQDLATGRYGRVIRAKGFIRDTAGLCEVSFVDGDITLKRRLLSAEPLLSFIGLGMDQESIARLFP
jgi:G3E family GTPase